MKRLYQSVSLGMSLLFVFGAAACAKEPTQQGDPSEFRAERTESEPPVEQYTIDFPGEGDAAETEKTSLFPAAAATPEPTNAATPTRAPIAGDVTTHFPNYDTGLDADYSYQSDELRIAIQTVVIEDIGQVYYVADIWIRNISAFRTGFGRGQFNTGTEDAEAFSVREHAVFGLSGTYNEGILFHNGELVRRAPSDDNEKYRGVMVLYADGSMKAFDLDHDTFRLNDEIEKGVVHIWQFGPTLVQNGAISGSSMKKSGRHPRAIVGYVEPGHYILVAVDGRTKKAIGMTEPEMAELMLSLGCTEAMNLDGGTSAVMTFMGKIISTPSVMGTGREEGGRNLKDMLLFAEYDAQGNAPVLSEIPTEKYREK